MDRRYCNRICTEIMNLADYDNTNKQTGVGHYEKSAREIEAELYNNYFLKDKIDIVFESTKLLQELQKRKNNTLTDDEG